MELTSEQKRWDAKAVRRDRTVAVIGELIIWAGTFVLVAAAAVQVANERSAQGEEQREWRSQVGPMVTDNRASLR